MWNVPLMYIYVGLVSSVAVELVIRPCRLVIVGLAYDDDHKVCR